MEDVGAVHLVDLGFGEGDLGAAGVGVALGVTGGGGRSSRLGSTGGRSGWLGSRSSGVLGTASVRRSRWRRDGVDLNVSLIQGCSV